MTDFTWLDATDQARLVQTGEVQPLELVDAAIKRIERVNPEINAVVTPMFEVARERARGELPDGPFRGVPFLLKDLLATYEGVRYTMGSRAFRDRIAPHDAEIVRRHKKAGLVVVGRTNTPELGIVPTTEPELFGPCKNPWDPTRTPGGSSGGSAAAVAAGLVPFAHANDGGGSIRIPAACCGLFGLKPTRARNPMGPDFGDSRSGIAAEHAVTRTVRDSAALLDATAGPDVGDPYWAPPPARPFLEEVGAPPGKLRIAFTAVASSGAPVHEDCARAVRDAAALCESLGHHVEEAEPEVGDPMHFTHAFLTLWSSGVSMTVQSIAETLKKLPQREDFESLTWGLHEMGREYSAPDYLLAVKHLQRTSRDIARFFTSYDVLITPTTNEPPVPLGTFEAPPDSPLTAIFRSGGFASFTALYNVTGQPAASIPLFWNDAGLPIGTHLVGRFGDEATLLRLSAQLEEAHPWAQRRPPISA